MHEPERRRRLSLPAARAAPPASSRPYPRPGSLPRSPSSSTSRCVGLVIFTIPLQMSENRTAKIDGPMTFGDGIDATDSACKNQRCGTNICFSCQRAGRHNDDRPLVTLGLEKFPRGETLFDFSIRSSGDAYGFACSSADIVVES